MSVKSRVEQSSIEVCANDEYYNYFTKNIDNSNIAGFSEQKLSDVDFTKKSNFNILKKPNNPLKIDYDCSEIIEESTYSNKDSNPISRYTRLTSPIIHTKGNDRRFNRWNMVDKNLERFVSLQRPVNTHLQSIDSHKSVCKDDYFPDSDYVPFSNKN